MLELRIKPRLHKLVALELFLIWLTVLLFMIGMLPKAQAVTPPAPVAPSIAKALYSWTVPTTRADTPPTPLPLSELKEIRLYISSLAAYIAVPAPATSYVYVVPSGKCLLATDSAQVTAIDTSGLESAASVAVSVPGDLCSGKSAPAAPGNVKVTVQ